MTHCNAGALATCGWGTATSPLFLAHLEGLPLEVWVSETRPRHAGRQPHRVGARPARHSAHALRRQRVRPPDAARRRRRRDRRRGSRGRATATCATRSARTTRRSPRATTTCRSTSRCRRRPSTGGCASGEAIPIEVRDSDEVTIVSGPRRLRADGARRHRAAQHQGAELRVRRDARAPRHRLRHRTRDHARIARVAVRDVSRAVA